MPSFSPVLYVSSHVSSPRKIAFIYLKSRQTCQSFRLLGASSACPGQMLDHLWILRIHVFFKGAICLPCHLYFNSYISRLLNLTLGHFRGISVQKSSAHVFGFGNFLGCLYSWQYRYLSGTSLKYIQGVGEKSINPRKSKTWEVGNYFFPESVNASRLNACK